MIAAGVRGNSPAASLRYAAKHPRRLSRYGGTYEHVRRFVFPQLALPVAVTSIGFAVVQLDVTIVNVALPRIVAALQWIAARQAGGAVGVALPGALMGGGSGSMISGLHEAAHVSAALLVVAATIVWTGVHRSAEGASVVACRRSH